MTDELNDRLCNVCEQRGAIASCKGCEKSFCTRHFIKHRIDLAGQMTNIRQDLNSMDLKVEKHVNFDGFMKTIDLWEEKSLEKIRLAANQLREDVRKSLETRRTELKTSINGVDKKIRQFEKSDNFTEIDVQNLIEQLSCLREIIENVPPLSIDEENETLIRSMKLVDENRPSTPLKQHDKKISSPKRSCDEQFSIMFGPCQLTDENRLVKQISYRNGLSQISGIQKYSSGKHSIKFLIEQKGSKNIFFGIRSACETSSLASLDSSLYGWWNFDHLVIDGESKIENSTVDIQTGDRVRLLIDCDRRQIKFDHCRTKRSSRLPIELEVCPFPWKIIVRLLTTGDAVRILQSSTSFADDMASAHNSLGR